ncbi:iron-sulfur cluster assembly scaffold protein [Limnochorda pilosa]|uniref:Nitrogen-fixing NifU domain-containing protein n=1 Tax=Limnochorda pilosa TaxID=1555112 RepID=A0A0K2SN51_LIMPI|nr:iron-sulfur cluster assembly scaffold protein [Limnochorda pilosa]BAS28541.1 nitrogen-fixing NifU domain-containing protein [Limnochorda pilosa]
MDRQTQIEFLDEHYRKARGKGTLEGADVVIPGGNPGCGDVVTIYLKGDGRGGIDTVRFEGEGCTISQAAASILMEMVAEGSLDADRLLAMDGMAMMDILGRDLVASRPKCATLALGTLKTALRQYRRKLDPGSLGEGTG